MFHARFTHSSVVQRAKAMLVVKTKGTIAMQRHFPVAYLSSLNFA